MKKSFLFLTFFIFSILSMFPLETTKKDENSISMREIDQLIKDTEYNRALELLSQYIKDNPTKFDIAQRRINKIINNRQKYNELASELVEVLEKEPENSVKIYEITEKLESFEHNPSNEALAFIQQAKQASRFAYFKSKYDATMDNGSDMVSKSLYVEAIDNFKGGFDLYKDDYDAKNYGPEITIPVSNALASVNKTTQQFSTNLPAFIQAKNAYIAAVKKQDLALSRTTLSAVKTQFANLAQIRNETQASGQELAEILVKLQKDDPTIQESSYVAFLMHFVLGRNSDPDCGILAAMDAFYNRSVEEMKAETLNTVFAKLNDTKSVRTRSPALTENINASNGFALLAADCQRLYSLSENVVDGKKVNFASKFSNFENSLTFVPKYLSLYGEMLDGRSDLEALKKTSDENLAIFKAEKDRNASTSTSFVAVLNDVLEYEKMQDAANILKNNPTIISQIDAEKMFLEKKSETEETASDEKSKRTTAGCEINDDIIVFAPYTSDFTDFVSKTESLSISYSIENWVAVASAYAIDSNATLVKNQTDFEKARNTFYGTDFEKMRKEIEAAAKKIAESNSEVDDFENRKQYPTESLAEADRIIKTIRSDLSKLKDYLATLETANQNSKSDETFIGHKTGVENDIEALNNLIPKLEEFYAICFAEVQKSTVAKNEADLRYNEALNYLRREQFDEARANLQRARVKYNESLLYQESEKLRAETDSKLAQLGEDLARRENEVVVRDVRALKNNAKKAYFDGDFEKAENDLTQARNRWAVTNVEEDQEILNLMALVTTALSMKTGREIPPASPLYPEMSQILNNARLNYEQGKKLIAQKKTSEAKTVLNEAKDQIHTVQLVFPLNKDASLLSLRIDQLIDPENFSSMFDQRVAAAKENYKNTVTRQSAYMDLLDLYEINPKYPGLKQLIYDIEIAIGIRQKPVDNSAKTRSQNLTREAQNIFNSANGNEERLRVALANLDEAIKLNPDNSAAQNLKDKIQTSIGGQAAVVLSSSDEALFQRAINALQKNNIITANALVEQLLQKPNNRRSAKILDLQKKVQALL